LPSVSTIHGGAGLRIDGMAIKKNQFQHWNGGMTMSFDICSLLNI